MPRISPAERVSPYCRRGQVALRAWRRPLIGAAVLLPALLVWGLWGGFATVMNTLISRALIASDLPAAERRLMWSRRLHCHDGRTELLEARLFRRQNRLVDMRRHLQRAQRLGVAVELLEREQWLALAQAGQMHDAGPHLDRLLIDPRGDEAEICEAYAIGYLLTYQIDHVEAILKAWAADFPKDHRPPLIHARLLKSSHNWNGAESAYRKALELAPACDEAMRGLADVLMTQQRPAEALEWYRRVPEASPHSIDALISTTSCLLVLGHADEARRLLSELLMAHPEHPMVLQTLGRLELETGNFVRAADLLRKAHLRQPDSDEVLFVLVAALSRLGAADEAVKVLEAAERIRKTNTEISRLQAIVAHDPDNVEARYEIGKHLLSIGSRKEALIWLKSVLQFEPAHTAARDAITETES